MEQCIYIYGCIILFNFWWPINVNFWKTDKINGILYDLSCIYHRLDTWPSEKYNHNNQHSIFFIITNNQYVRKTHQKAWHILVQFYIGSPTVLIASLQWRHYGRDGVSNHQPRHCLLNRLFRRRSKKNQSSAWLAFVRRIHRWPVNSSHKWPVSRKMFPFDDFIMF